MMKKLCLFLFVATCFVTGNSQNYNYDVNGDGVVTAADVTAIYDYLLESSGHEWVDLGLPSGTLWATMNVGAYYPEGYGDYFAWGETVPKYRYNWQNYKWIDSEGYFTKYCTLDWAGIVDNKTELDLEDDAAYVNWGLEWRTPTKQQFQELINRCTRVWTTRNGINGYLFTASNGASLFFPAAGGRSDKVLNGLGERGVYWSRNLECTPDDENPYAMSFYGPSDEIGGDGLTRCGGVTVRAVRAPQK